MDTEFVRVGKGEVLTFGLVTLWVAVMFMS